MSEGGAEIRQAFNARSLGADLAAHRNRGGATKRSVEQRLHNFLRQKEKPHEANTILPKKIEATGKKKPSTLVLSIDQVRALAHAYGVSSLLVESHRSMDLDADQLRLSWDDFRQLSWASPQYGDQTTYFIPRRRIPSKRSVQLVRVLIESGGSSDKHSHNGDELLLVLDGRIDTHLHPLGLNAVLSTGEFVQFNAELEHTVYNVGSKQAELLVVRMNSRNELEADQSTVGVPGRAIDALGLATFIEYFRRSTGKSRSLRELASRAGVSRSTVGRIQKGERPITVDEFPLISKMYDIEEVLLHDFLIPAFHHAIAVKKDEYKTLRRRTGATGKAVGGNATYHVPTKRLLEADTSIARIDFGPQEETPLNRHPGHEVIFVEEGELVVQFENGNSVSLSAGECPLSFFDSRSMHKVCNDQERSAKALVVRIYQYG